MITRSIEGITIWLIKHDAIKSEDRELYEYAVHSFIMTLAPLILISIMGAFMGRVKEGILIILPFMFIRKFSGGYHAKHEWACLLGSSGLLFLCLCVSSHIQSGLILDSIVLGSVVSLCLCSPIDSENRRLAPEENRIYKIAAGGIAIAFGIVYKLLIVNKMDSYAVCIAVGLILSAGLQIPCMFSFHKNER